MKGRNFIDTNILIYLYSQEACKQNKIISLLNRDEIFVISTQIIMEFCNVLVRKLKYTKSELYIAIEDFNRNFEISLINQNTIEKALEIYEIYKYSLFDCLVISTSLEANCSVIYSEDMQHNQMIDNKVKIINPFM
ncbi:MAG: PIN domain-containing protein [Candidatus Eremiobacterota bacterium]